MFVTVPDNIPVSVATSFDGYRRACNPAGAAGPAGAAKSRVAATGAGVCDTAADRALRPGTGARFCACTVTTGTGKAGYTGPAIGYATLPSDATATGYSGVPSDATGTATHPPKLAATKLPKTNARFEVFNMACTPVCRHTPAFSLFISTRCSLTLALPAAGGVIPAALASMATILQRTALRMTYASLTDRSQLSGEPGDVGQEPLP